MVYYTEEARLHLLCQQSVPTLPTTGPRPRAAQLPDLGPRGVSLRTRSANLPTDESKSYFEQNVPIIAETFVPKLPFGESTAWRSSGLPMASAAPLCSSLSAGPLA